MSKETIKSIFAVALSVTSVAVLVTMTFSPQEFCFSWIIWIGMFLCGIDMLN